MIINLVLTAIFLLLIGLSVLHGIFRGVGKARIRGIGMLLAAVVAVLLTALTKKFWVSEQLLDGVLAEMGNEALFVEMMENSPTLGSMLFECMASLIAPLLCLIYFVIAAIFFWIVYLVLSMTLGDYLQKHDEKCKFAKIRAGIWGGVWGAVIAVMIMIPISGYMELAAPVSSGILKSEILTQEREQVLQDVLDEYIAPIDGGSAKVFRVFGGGYLVDSLTDFELNGQNIDFSEEIDSVSSLACGIIQLTNGAVVEYGAKEAIAVDSVADAFEDSVLLPQIAGELIFGVTDSWLSDRTFLGIAPPSAGNMANLFDPFLNASYEILRRDAHDPNALQADIRTVANMMNIFVDHRVFETLSNRDRLMTVLSTDGITGKLILELGENDSMKALIPEVTNFGVRALALTLQIPNNSDEVYAAFFASVANAVKYIKILPEEQRAESLASRLQTCFDEAGIPVDEELLICCSLSMIKDMIDTEQATHITSDDAKAFFELCAKGAEKDPSQAVSELAETVALSDETEETTPKTADPYVNTVYEGMTERELQKTGAYVLAKTYRELLCVNVDSAREEAKNIVKENYATLWEDDSNMLGVLDDFLLTAPLSEDAYEAMLALKSPESFITTRVLLHDLIIDAKEAESRLDAEGVSAEAEMISQIFVAANQVYRKVEYGNNIGLPQISAPLGEIMDAVKLSVCYGEEKTAGLFFAIMQSERVRTSANLDVKTATLMAQKATEGDSQSYQKTIIAISKAVTILNDYNYGDREVSDAQWMDLMKDINHQNAAVIEIYVTPDRVESYGMGEKYSQISSEIVGNTLHSLANKMPSDAQYSAEATALNSLMNLAFAAKENAGAKYLFAKEGHPSVFSTSSEETVRIFMASESVMAALKTSLLNADGTISADRFDVYDLGKKQPSDSNDHEDLLNVIKSYYEQNQNEETKQNLSALAALFGVSENP